MKKNVKRVMTTALTVSTLLCAAPIAASGESIFAVAAYADSDNTTTELSSLKLKTSGGSTIKIYDDKDYKSKDQVDSDEVKSGDTYYAKTSSSRVKINIDGPDSKYVRVFKGTASSGTGKKVGTSLSLSSGTNRLIVRVYDSDPGSSVKYKDDDYKSEYIIKVKYTGDDDKDDDDDEDYDDIYLSNISLSDGSINFSKKTSKYDVYVDENVSSLTIKAKPEDDDYDVEIDGKDVDEDDKWKTDVSLTKGSNTVYIDIEDDDDNERTYTLNIYRGAYTPNSTTSSNNSGYVGEHSDKRNQWAIVDGAWRYYDSDGNYLRNTWFYDTGYCSTYYFREDGSMATGWIKDGNNWFYADNSGARRTGWQYVSGKWYYMQSNGIMAQNTRIGAYAFGADGAWIY